MVVAGGRSRIDAVHVDRDFDRRVLDGLGNGDGAVDAGEAAPDLGEPQVAADEGDLGMTRVDGPDAGDGQVGVGGGGHGGPSSHLCASAHDTGLCTSTQLGYRLAMAVDDRQVAAWRAVLLTQDRVVRAIDADLAAAGLIPLSWYDVLLELHEAQTGSLRMQDLGERVVLSRSRVSRLVDDLEAERLVERRPDPTDGRATLARLTPAGRRMFRRAAKVYLRGIDEHFNAWLSEAERSAIASGLERVIANHPTRP